MKHYLLSFMLLAAPIACFSDEIQWAQSEHSTALHIQVKTERLMVRSIESADLPHFCALYANPTVMASFAAGLPRTFEATTDRFNLSWSVRWQTGDPFSAMSVFINEADAEPKFIGAVVMGHGDMAGESELAFLFFPEYWNQGYGKEAVTAVVKTLGRMLVEKGYGTEGVPLKEIHATCRADNIASVKILQGLGMHEVGRVEKYGSERILFSIPASEL
jgi:RimJ/RimL family protein N-acetyltransferase